jgi:hypothetical protein
MSKKYLQQQIEKLERRVAKLEMMNWWDGTWSPLAGENRGRAPSPRAARIAGSQCG